MKVKNNVIWAGVLMMGMTYAIGYAQTPSQRDVSEVNKMVEQEKRAIEQSQVPQEEEIPNVLAFEGVVEEMGQERMMKVKASTNEVVEFIIDRDAFIFVNEDTVDLDKVKKGDKVYITFQEKDGKKLADWVEVTR